MPHQKLKQHVRDNRARWVRGVVFALLFVIVPIVGEYWFMKVTPSTYWFEYIAIEPQKQVASTGEVIKFISTTEIKQQVDFEWHDVMRCADPDGYEYYYRDYKSQAAEVEPRAQSSSTWQYPHGLPHKVGTCCWLESTITVPLHFGIEKQQQLLSGQICIQ